MSSNGVAAYTERESSPRDLEDAIAAVAPGLSRKSLGEALDARRRP